MHFATLRLIYLALPLLLSLGEAPPDACTQEGGLCGSLEQEADDFALLQTANTLPQVLRAARSHAEATAADHDAPVAAAASKAQAAPMGAGVKAKSGVSDSQLPMVGHESEASLAATSAQSKSLLPIEIKVPPTRAPMSRWAALSSLSPPVVAIQATAIPVAVASKPKMSDAASAHPAPVRLAVSLAHQNTEVSRHLLPVLETKMNTTNVMAVVVLSSLGMLAIWSLMAIIDSHWNAADNGKERQPKGQYSRKTSGSLGKAVVPPSSTGGDMYPKFMGSAEQHLMNATMGSARNLASASQLGTMPSVQSQSPRQDSVHSLRSAPDSRVVLKQGNASLDSVVESRFAVSLSALARAGPECAAMDVVSLAGLPLLSMSIVGGRRLDLCLAHQSSTPRCSILAPAMRGGAFAIHDPQDRPCGNFLTISPGLTEVSVEGKPAMMVDGQSAKLQFVVTSAGNQPVAVARINTEDFEGDHFEIRVLPGEDAVTVLAVLLSLAVFTSEII